MTTRTERTASSSVVRVLSPVRDFLHTESAGALLIAAATITALVWANSPWSGSYDSLWHSDIAIELAGHELRLDLRHWLNDGLMTLFFLVVGLEIKRELTHGHLASRRAVALPVAAALGGMVAPALIYLAIAGGTEPNGWAIPMATDIALAIGLVGAAGPRVDPSLRVLLLGLAIVDDIGAIVVIAAFYSGGVRGWWLIAAAGLVAATLAMRALGVNAGAPYWCLGAALWLALHEGGVHATLAGVAMGLMAPSTPRVDRSFIDIEELNDLSSPESARASVGIARSSVSVVEWLQHMLHPWTSYVIVPIFALANAGLEISTSGLSDAARSPVTWGVMAGLVIGKPLGILLASWGAARTGIADVPSGGVRARAGIGASAGIGFTVALFITSLAFDDAQVERDAKLGVLVASVLAAAIGWALLSGSGRPRRAPDGPEIADADVTART